ncbi:MAG: replication-associated recombination protein A [Clostridia bacterium]|nr:replication-associated recombination protein A [Clostridia bacterium]MDY5558690.1 replication-associated recombination protein A [Candidatus Heritagella sp.]
MAAPLADRIRPQTLDEIVGQSHLLGKGMPLRRIAESGEIPNMVFYGPSGVGKTTVASILAKSTHKHLCKLNGTTASTADIREVIARTGTLDGMNGVLLYLDEIQYFNKKQQQTLLEFLENGSITLIASTTENPYFYVYGAILSRSTVFEFKPVQPREVAPAVRRAFSLCGEDRQPPIEVEESAVQVIAAGCGGDVRKAVNAVELCVLTAVPREDGTLVIGEELARSLTQRSAMRYDRDGDEHYDIVSAYQKSMRGSDPDAALHYLARLLEAGDLPSACRRLLVCASEDVGLAWPQILPIVKAAVDTAMMVGLPEAQLPLADAVLLVCMAPKSNSAHDAIRAAMKDVQDGKVGAIPRHLQNRHYDGADAKVRGQHYLYPHDYPGHWVGQSYLPDLLRDRHYYEFGDNKNEQAFKAYWDQVKKSGKAGG